MTKSLFGFVLFTGFASMAIAAPESYTVDPSHTYAHFDINHLGFSTTHGRFNKTEGKIELDRQAKKGMVDITIDASSVDTGFAKREEHLKGEDFFNVAQFPTITYRSDKLIFNGDTLSKVDGSLTLLGVTKPVTLTVTSFRCGDHFAFKKFACGADATTTIKRSDFGMSKLVGPLGDEVRIVIQIEAPKN